MKKGNFQLFLRIFPRFLFELMISIFNWNQYRVRRGGVYWDKRKEVKQLWSMDSENLKAYQIERLAEFLSFCRNNSAFYSARIPVQVEKGLDFLKRLDKLSKTELIHSREEISTITVLNGVASYTGGTTGASLKVVYRRDDLQERFAYLDEFRALHGYELGLRVAWFSGKELINARDIGKNVFYKTDFINKIRFYSTFHITEKTAVYYAKTLSEFNCKYIVGFPSSISRICKYCEALGISFDGRIDVFFPTAETVTQEHRDVISRFFGCKVVDQYASSEGAPFIFECSEGKLHADITTGVFEVVDDDGVNADEGEVLVTSFQTRGTPLVRYKIGDSIKLGKGSCVCGWGLPIVDSIKGRVDDYIDTPVNGQINLGNISNATKNVLGIISFQLIQHTKTCITVKIVAGYSFDQKEKQKFGDALNSRFGNEVQLNLVVVENIALPESGKFQMIVKDLEVDS
jgi:phenylacetate-CoA ligase